MAKAKTKKKIREVKKLKIWQLSLLLVLAMFLAATFARLDNIGMVQRRAAVIGADEIGDRELLNNRLLELRRYVFEHMNSSTGTFYLANQYERDSQAILARAEEEARRMDENPNGNVFQQAAAVCDPLARQFGWGYTKPYFDCITTELDKFAVSGEITDEINVELPNKDLYRIDYVSPKWTVSSTGFAVLACVILVVMIVVRAVMMVVLQAVLKSQQGNG